MLEHRRLLLGLLGLHLLQYGLLLVESCGLVHLLWLDPNLLLLLNLYLVELVLKALNHLVASGFFIR
jgi:hypothetical protein